MAEVRNNTTTTTTSDFNHISPSALNGNGIGSNNTNNTHLAATAARNAQLNNSNSMNTSQYTNNKKMIMSTTTTTTLLSSSSSTHHQLPQNMRVNNPLLTSTPTPTVTTSNTNTSPPSTNTTTFPTTSTLGVPNPIFNANTNNSSGIQISPVIVNNGTSPIMSSSTKAYDTNSISTNSNNNHNMNMDMNNRPRAQSMSALHPTNQAHPQQVQQHQSSSSSVSQQKDRRMKRLERNRESARVSRRRRKQYLEVLEERVVSLSRDMDVGRCQHVQKSIPTITHLRYKTIEAMMQVYRNTTTNSTTNNTKTEASGSVVVKKEQQMKKQRHDQLELLENTLETYLSRTSDELRLCTIFQREQLSSMVLAPHQRFILWLTLQNDIFFLGGRGASERLSAARIGERVS